MLSKVLLDSLNKIKQNHQNLNQKLSNPQIINDLKKYQAISKEVSEIDDVVNVFNQYLNQEEALKQAKSLLIESKDAQLIELAKEEIEKQQTEIEKTIKDLKILLLPKDHDDNKNVIVEIRGAAGGQEANIFAGDLFEIYKKWALNNDIKIKSIAQNKSDSGGFTLVVFKMIGKHVYGKLKFESGVHRVQRIPSTETQGRVHTSTATVTVIPEIDETTPIKINPQDLKVDTYRASGAGGQHINKTDSAVRITHLPTKIVVQSQDGRSQIANRELAMSILNAKLYQLEIEKKQAQDAKFRKLAGSGARSEKIRTYNYPQDRVTDHRINFSTSLKSVASGKLEPIIDALNANWQAQKMKEFGF